MKIILCADVQNLGKQGDVKNVAEGFARNYLVPKKLALEATDQNLKVWEKEKQKLEKQKGQLKESAKELAEKIEKHSFTIMVKTGESGRLFGSVTNANVAKALEENGFTVDKHDVLLDEPLKEVGVYTVEVRVHPEVTAKAKIWIVEEKEENKE